jgi:hypothetical protein
LSDSSNTPPVTGETPVVAVAGVIKPAGWPDVVRGACVCAAAVAVAWKNPAVAEWALLVLATVASPALARALLDRFRR